MNAFARFLWWLEEASAPLLRFLGFAIPLALTIGFALGLMTAAAWIIALIEVAFRLAFRVHQ